MRALKSSSAWATALPLFTLLAACSGGSGGAGIGSAPPPPASYTKIADMTGDRSFQTAGIQYDTSPAGFSNASSYALGSGVTVAYTAANDTYRLTAPDGTSATFDPSSAQQPTPGSNSQIWIKTVGTTRDQFTLTVPTVSGVPLSYTVLGIWGHIDTATNHAVFRLAVGGAPTLASDMPKSGTATYSVGVRGGAVPTGGGSAYTLNANSTATFSANFGTGAISTSLALAGTPASGGSAVTSFGTFNGTGTIASNSPGFTGTLSGTGATGLFSGAFFGPQASEMGYDWSLTAPSFTAVGTVTGVKQ
ncbi:hypothetical protein GCM10009087_51850 [Sphingomonas oligophenolica]|uniref:Transferrin-binding protein-like solute binding protein n=1 Tax=Sphingomonas oligophenolica TaxID=301154 RepID=A0ABU9Y6U9_9SPHN